MTDLSTGLYAYGAILSALLYRGQTGRGQHIDCNLLNTQVNRIEFTVAINTDCEGVCYRIYAQQKFLNNALAPYGALALFGIFAGRISCNKRPHNRYLFLL